MDVPRRLGRYDLLERVGEGSLGVLYRGWDTKLDREVAAKVLQAAFQGDADARARFFREAKAAARLQHAHIVSTFEFGEDDGTPFIVMEFLRGRPLADRLREGPPLAPLAVLEIGIQICAGLEAAHQQGVVHRAVNPKNVWLCPDGSVKLLDFGLATALASATTMMADSRRVAYLSPEQVEGREVDARSDIFAVGAVLYEMFAGRPPFHAAGPVEVMHRIVTEPPNPIESLQERPRAVDAAIARALEKSPAARFASAAEFLRTLKALKAEIPIDPDPATVLLEPTILEPPRRSAEDTRRDPPTWLALLRRPFTHLRLSRRTLGLAGVALLLAASVMAWSRMGSPAAPVDPVVNTKVPDNPPPPPPPSTTDKPPVANTAKTKDGEKPRPPVPPAPVTPAPVPPPTLLITSTPSAARILVDGRGSGLTTPGRVPVVDGKKPPTIQVELAGYEPQRVTVTSDLLRAGSVDVTLVRRPPAKPMDLVATGDYPFDVTDGRQLLSRNKQRHDVDVSGLPSVLLRSDQYFLHYPVKLNPDEGGTVKVAAPRLGSLSIYATGPLEVCKVYVDGRLVDIPVARREVASGPHEVQLRCLTGSTDPKTITVEPNVDSAVRFPRDTPLRPK